MKVCRNSQNPAADYHCWEGGKPNANIYDPLAMSGFTWNRTIQTKKWVLILTKLENGWIMT